MLTFRAFMDDSGSDWKSPPRRAENQFFVLAGHLSSIPQWEEFADLWQSAIDGPPKIEYFKASQAQSLKAQFQGWTASDRDKLLVKLSSIINEVSLLRIQVALPQKLYNDYIKGRIPERWDHPYFLCLLSVVDMVCAQFYEKFPGVLAKLDFTFDEQQQLKKEAERVCDFYRTSRLPYAHLIGKISHENDNDFLPLQAADLEAWLTRRTLSGLVDADRECFSPIRSLTPVSYTIKQADVEYFVAKIWSGMQTLVIPTVGTRKKLHPFFRKMIVGGLDR